MVLFDLPLWIVLLYLFVLGAVVGSFLSVCIHRLAEFEIAAQRAPRSSKLGWIEWVSTWWVQDVCRPWVSVAHPHSRSRCPRCRNAIRWYDNIPIFSWAVLLRGRCRACRQWISARYPGLELLNGLLFAGLYWLEIPADWAATIADGGLAHAYGPQGAGGGWLSPVAVLHWRFLYHLILVEALVVATFIDYDLQIIPDSVTVPGMLVGVLGGLLIGQVHLVPVWYSQSGLGASLLAAFEFDLPPALAGLAASGMPAWALAHPHLHGLAVSAAGFVIGGGVVWLVRIIGQRTLQKEAMGFGDVTLMAMIGTFLGWQPVLVIFFLAPAFALLAALFYPQRETAYGPYLSMATLALLFGWGPLWPAAERVFELGVLLPVVAVVFTVLFYILLQLVQGVKRALGWDLEEPLVGEWTGGDQLHYISCEWTDHAQGQWPRSEWPGARSGSGSAPRHDWRHGQTSGNGSAWRQHWQRAAR